MDNLNLKNKPDIQPLGPIAEIQPHGSTFPEVDKRPQLVYHFSFTDIAQLKTKGTDISNLGIYYLNETGDIENANAEIITTNYGYEIRTVLSHFSPYTLLEGEVPPQPTIMSAYTLARDHLKVFGKAKPNSSLEIYIGTDIFFGDKIETLNTLSTTTNVAAWIFSKRQWGEDYADNLSTEEKAQITATRQMITDKLAQAIAQNTSAETAAQKLYQELVSSEQDNVARIRNYLINQKLISINALRIITVNGADNNIFEKITENSGINQIQLSATSLNYLVPTLNTCLANILTLAEIQTIVKRFTDSAQVFTTQTDATGWYSYDLPIATTTNLNVFITYTLTGNIKNRPVNSLAITRDTGDYPQFTTLSVTTLTVNALSSDPQLNIVSNKSGRVMATIHNLGTLRNTLYIPVVSGNPGEMILPLSTLPDSTYTLTAWLVDDSGKTGLPIIADILVDRTPPTVSDLIIPAYLNPRTTELNINTNVSYNIQFNAPLTIDGEYTYLATLTDPAGNTASITGSIIVDTLAPSSPAELKILHSNASGALLSWVSSENNKITIQYNGLTQLIQTAQNVLEVSPVSENSFYTYTLESIDQAGNISSANSITTYCGSNKTEAILTNQLTLSHNSCVLKISTTQAPSNSLVVIQDSLLVPTTNGLNRAGSTTYHLLTNTVSTFNTPVTIAIAYDPGFITKQQILPASLHLRYWNGWSWTSEGLKLITVNHNTHTVIAETNHFSDYCLMGSLDYHSFDFVGPEVCFTDIRNGDYLDTTVTINLIAKDTTSAINTKNMSLVLDNITYTIPENNLNQTHLAINLQTIAGVIPEKEHTLTITITDLANNTTNTTVQFSNKQNFKITKVLPVPNPFNGEGIHFTYQLTQPATAITIKIYTTNGQLIKTISNCANITGFNKTFWDGIDEHGLFVANDVYLYTVIIETPAGEKEIIKGKLAAIR